VLRGLNSASVDLIYLDPPFNKKKEFVTPTGTHTKGASFEDIFKKNNVNEDWVFEILEDHPKLHNLLNAVKGIEGRASYNFYYLNYMAIRLIECRRILKDTGSIYLHCDPTMSHYLKLVMDYIFGEKNFRNEIIWKRKNDVHNRADRVLGGIHDAILWYGDIVGSKYNKQYFPYDSGYIASHYNKVDSRGRYRLLPCTNESGGNKPYKFKGMERAWRWKEERMKKMHADDMLVQLNPKGPWYYKKYLQDAEGVPLQDIWNDIDPVRGKKHLYQTQKPLALLERIIKMSSNEGDMVLDPFCGCATTPVAAERLNRQWIGIDVSIKAYELVQDRINAIQKEMDLEGDEKTAEKYAEAIKYIKERFTAEPPTRTDDGAPAKNPKYVYVISHPKHKGKYKVGQAKNTKIRLGSYQTGDPDRAYKLEHARLTPRYAELERYIHNKFNARRDAHSDRRYEWVEADLQAIIDAIEAYN